MPVEIEEMETAVLPVPTQAGSGGLSTELEKKVIAKVIEMLLRDLRIEAERAHRGARLQRDWRGGR